MQEEIKHSPTDSTEPTYYVHLLSFISEQGMPGHSAVVVTDSPYSITTDSIKGCWSFPMDTRLSHFDRYLRQLVCRDIGPLGLLCVGKITKENFTKAEEEISKFYGISTSRFLGKESIRSSFGGRTFNKVTNSCLMATKKILGILCPEAAETINQFGVFFPNQFLDKMYRYVQQQQKRGQLFDHALILPKDGFFPERLESREFKKSLAERWQISYLVYNDRLSRQRNLYIGLSTASILSGTFISDSLSRGAISNLLSNDALPTTATLIGLDMAALIVITLILATYTEYKKHNNPYKNQYPLFNSQNDMEIPLLRFTHE